MKKLNGIHLKLIACGAMLTDHACKVLIPGTEAAAILVSTVGRVAFPIFAYLLIEGFMHTRSRARYALNLFIVALISEIPFDMAFRSTFFYWSKQNTCFTLFLGLLFFICLEKCENSEKAEKTLYMILVTAAFACLFYFGKFDYGLQACICFLICYMLRYQAPWFVALLMSTVLVIAYKMPGVYLCVIPLALYSRQRGNASAVVKYLFYIFYPAHLIILAVIRNYI